MIEASTPLMRQYQSIKKRYPHALLLFRLGDFYELFYEDALVASKELQITLTSRNRERGEPIPMCGVPFHAAETYIARLLRAGFKIAICDQMEQPGPGKHLVRREVVRVITPGTATDLNVLEPKENNFLAAVARGGAGFPIGLAYLDLSTGEFRATEFAGPGAEQKLHDELELLCPRELLLPRQPDLFAPLTPSQSNGTGNAAQQAAETRLEEWIFRCDYGQRLLSEHFGVAGLEGFGLATHPQAICAAGALLHYLRENSPQTHAHTSATSSAKTEAKAGAKPCGDSPLAHLDTIRYYEQRDSLVLDPVTVRNLELLSPLDANEAPRASQRDASLFGAIDQTVTVMGARLLRAWILRPELSRPEIEARLDAVTEFKSQTMLREELRQNLRGVQDLERLASRATLGVATPRDLVALRQSVARVPLLRRYLANCTAARPVERIVALHAEMDELADVQQRLEQAIAEDPPALASDPGVIRRGFDAELDGLRDLSHTSRQTIAAMEDRERKRTAIGSLKIRYNQVFGFYIEISKPNLHLAPPGFERKQTLANAERFTTPELKEYEGKVLAADERIAEIERRLFAEVRSWIAQQSPRLRRTAAAIAQLDVLANFAVVAATRRYVRPEFTDNGELVILGGRHPVIEHLLEDQGERFVPNGLYLNSTSHQILLITGPNMGGKSTYLRQSALVVLLAQMGSFVPAEQARLPITDRIFTRIGASDNLARGRSTFLVEMSEVAAILNLATPHSLVLLDEVGRGTATFDGLSIAWAVVEYLQAHTRARTLFATHYHELTELADLLSGVKNVHVSVEETPSEIIFLKRVEEGSADKSYGIEVARLAGLPPAVIARAREVLRRHEQSEHQLSEKLTPALPPANGAGAQQALFPNSANDREALEALRAADLDQLRPIDALNLLAQLKKQIS